ncbi:MAG: WD40 repeat domain-containing protein [Bacteroidia bacterium]
MRLIAFCLVLASVSTFAQIEFELIANHQDDVSCLAFSPDNTHIVSGGWDSKLIVYANDSTYQVQQELKDFRGAVKTIAFSRDGFKMLAGGQEGKLAIYGFNDQSSWSIVGLDTFMEINNSQINKLIYGPGMRTVFSAGDDGRFLTYDLSKKKTLEVRTKRPISAACVAVDRRSYFISNEGSPLITQYNVFGKVMKNFSGHLNDITDLLVTPNRKYLISSSKDRTIKVWNLSNGKVEKTLLEHTWAVTDIELDPYGKFLVSCGLDGAVNLFNIETGEKLQQENLPRHRCNSVAISPDLTKIAVASHTDGAESTGFYIIPTELKPRKVRLPKRYFADKEEKAQYEAIYLSDEEQAAEASKDSKKTTQKSTPKKEANQQKKAPTKEEVILKKTEQVEIRIK